MAKKEKCHDDVTVAHARNLIRVYGNDPDHPWFLEWAYEIDRLASMLEGLGVEVTDQED